MKMKHKRIWALMMAVVLVLTAVFFDVPSRLKAESQAETSEVMLADVEETAATEETIDEAIPDEEVATEVTEEMTEDIVDEVTEDTSEDMTEETTEVVVEDVTNEEDTTFVSDLFDAILDLEEDDQSVLAGTWHIGAHKTEWVDNTEQASYYDVYDPNGNVYPAWCTNHGANTSFANKEVIVREGSSTLSPDAYKDVIRALYYSTGDGMSVNPYPVAGESNNGGNGLLALVLSNYYKHAVTNCPTVNNYMNWLSQQPYPMTASDLGNLSKTSVDVSNVDSDGYFKAAAVKYDGNLQFGFNLPANTKAIVSSDEAGTQNKTVYIAGQNGYGYTEKNKYIILYAKADVYAGKSITLDFAPTAQVYSFKYFEVGDGGYQSPAGAFAPTNPAHKQIVYKFAGNGCIELTKVSSNPGAVSNCDAYSFQNAEYGVYKTMAEATAKTNKQYSMITNAQGIAYLDNIPTGTYYLRELVAPKGYTLSNEIKTVTVTTTNTPANRAKVQFADAPRLDPITIVVTKQSDNKIVVPGAEYTIKFYKTSESYRTGVNKENEPSQNGYTVDRWWTFATDENGKINFRTSTKIAGSDFYLDAKGLRALPPGTITVQESKAPEGYELDPTIYVKTIDLNKIPEVEASNVKTDITDEHQNRGDVEFRKLDDNGKPLANVKFEISNDETKESHIVWTDADGYYSTAASYIPHTKNTNSGEQGDGVWFGDMDLLAKQPTWGALPSGNYTVTELRCEANKNFKNHAPITFEIKTDGELKKIDDLYNYPIKMTTTAVNPVTDTNVAAVGMDLTLMDKVDMQGLELGHNYKLVCKIYSKKDKDFLKKNDVVYEETVSFVADKVDDSKTVTVKVDITDDFAGQDIVFFEYLYDDAYPEIIKDHADESYEEQTIHFVKIGTQAKDAVSESQMGLISETSTIIDTVQYTNLVPNKKYVLKATLMDTEKNEPIMQDGKAIVVEHPFTPTEKNGEEDVEITFNSNVFTDGGTTAKSVTVFEEIFYNDHSLAMECDIKSEPQSIKYPTIGTTAKDKATDTHEALAGPVTIVDTVAFHGLLPGKEYEAVGVLKYLDGKDVLDADGKQITGTKTFTTDVPDGTVDVEITFDASLLEGETIIIWEDVLHKNKPVAVHHSLVDENQKIFIVKISTTAKDSVSLSHDGTLSETAKIIDTVMYSNTFKGETYEMVGWLMNKKTNAPFKDTDGNDIKATKRFVADEAGSVDMEYTINSLNFKDQDVVVFEELYRIIKNDDGTEKKILVAQHKNINDSNQTVHYDKAPKTGDSTPIVFVLVTMVACAAGIILLRRRKK